MQQCQVYDLHYLLELIREPFRKLLCILTRLYVRSYFVVLCTNGVFPRLRPANMSAVQGAVRLLCSDLLQFIYLLLVLPDLQLLIYLIHQEAARLALFARLLQAMPGGPQDPR